MKKFKLFTIFIVITYISILLVGNFKIKDIYNLQSGNYRVEINRLYRDYSETNSLDTGNSEYVKSIDYIDINEKRKDEIDKFYKSKNGMQSEIVPLYDKDNVIGYLKFNYVVRFNNKNIVYIYNIGISIIFIITLILIIYVQRKILNPFTQLSKMPYELSKGNLNYEVKENKDKYFGKFLWGVGMLKDTLEDHKRQELKLVKEKKMIILSMSHDIKTPLNAINLYAKTIEKEIYNTEKEKIEAAKKIQEKTQEIDSFVREIIKSSTEDILSIEVEDSEYYLEDLVCKVKNVYEEKASLNKIKFSIAEYKNHLLKGDIYRMYEAIGNLIENAFKYGDGNRIDMSFSEEDGYQLISIINSGNPVAENEISHLFDSFFRGSNSEGKQGEGLGLYICREIMRKMDGEAFANVKKNGMEFVLVCKKS